MTSLLNIEAFLNIQIGARKLRDGKRKKNKNQFYWYEELYYIVKLTKDMWVIMEDCRKTRQLLRDHTWHFGSSDGYARTKTLCTIQCWHKSYLNYEEGLVADHINKKRFDNRNENLRVVTLSINSRNKSKQCNNTSGHQGVVRNVKGRCEYWRVVIYDNNHKRITKCFSIAKLGEDEAKRQALEKRKELEIEYGYIGD